QVRVFVSWNQRIIDRFLGNPGPNTDPNFNPSAIQTIVSDDGAQSFAPQVILNSDTYGNQLTQPPMVFTAGRAGQTNSRGKLVTAYSDFYNLTPPATSIQTDSHTFTPTTIPHIVEVTNANGIGINDAATGDPNIPAATLYPINLTGQLGALTH